MTYASYNAGAGMRGCSVSAACMMRGVHMETGFHKTFWFGV